MGYYFPNACSKRDLNEAQLQQYESLHNKMKAELPKVLRHRIAVIENYVGPVTSGEVLAAYHELVQDMFASWVLADEDPEKVSWVELHESS